MRGLGQDKAKTLCSSVSRVPTIVLVCGIPTRLDYFSEFLDHIYVRFADTAPLGELCHWNEGKFLAIGTNREDSSITTWATKRSARKVSIRTSRSKSSYCSKGNPNTSAHKGLSITSNLSCLM